MKIPSYLRQPNPSEYLLKHGNIVEDSFYLVEDGLIYLEDGRRYPCTFEIAHMEDGRSWAVVYIPPVSNLNHYEVSEIERQIDSSQLKLIGQDMFWGASLKASTYQWVNKNGWSIADGKRIEFVIWRYEAVLAPEEVHKVVFSLANLSLNPQYSNKSVFERESRTFKESVQEVRFDTALDFAIKERGSTLTNDELKEKAKEAAKQEVEDFREGNNRPVYKRAIPININNQEIAKLYWARSYKEREYDLQPLSILRLDMLTFPDEWGHEEAADWICALFSLALGREIVWNYYHIPYNSSEYESVYLTPLRLWQTRTVNNSHFHAFTEEGGYFQQRIGIDEKTEAHNLVQDVLTYLFQLDDEARRSYLNALLTYIKYASTPASILELQCTLLCSLGEHIYKLWEDVTGNKFVPPIPKPSRKLILKDIETVLGTHSSIIVPPHKCENTADYYNRTKPVIEDIKSRMGYAFVGNLKDLFRWLFEQNGRNISNTTKSYYYIDYRIRRFVDSRNKLFHEHRFDSIEPSEISKEIVNIKMFIPLLLATVLQYKGRYWHSLAWSNSGRDKWEHMPRK